MTRTSRTLTIMLLVPPVLVFALTYLGAFRMKPAIIEYGFLIAPWAFGLTALATSGWDRKTIIGVGLFYSIAAVILLPTFALIAACSFGDCL